MNNTNICIISIVLPSKTSQVAGWGKTENSSHSDVLLKVQVPFFMSRECKLKYPILPIANDDRQICAGGEKGKKHRNKNILILN